MKVYRISRGAFLGICLLILVLPVSRHWKLLVTGERTTGTVTEYAMRVVDSFGDEKKMLYQSEIQFEAGGRIFKTYGPDDYEYRIGRTVTLFYNRSDPSDNCIVTFTGFYLRNYAVIPLMLLLIWYAFYLSFNNYRKPLKMPKGRPEQKPVHPSLVNRDEDSRSR